MGSPVQVYDGDGVPQTLEECYALLGPMLERFKDLNFQSARVLRDESSIRYNEMVRIVMQETRFAENHHLQDACIDWWKEVKHSLLPYQRSSSRLTGMIQLAGLFAEQIVEVCHGPRPDPVLAVLEEGQRALTEEALVITEGMVKDEKLLRRLVSVPHMSWDELCQRNEEISAREENMTVNEYRALNGRPPLP